MLVRTTAELHRNLFAANKSSQFMPLRGRYVQLQLFVPVNPIRRRARDPMQISPAQHMHLR